MTIRLFQLPRRFCWRRISREIYKNVSRFKSLTESEKFPYLSGNWRRIQDLKLKSDEIWIFCGEMTDWWLKLWWIFRKIIISFSQKTFLRSTPSDRQKNFHLSFSRKIHKLWTIILMSFDTSKYVVGFKVSWLFIAGNFKPRYGFWNRTLF